MSDEKNFLLAQHVIHALQTASRIAGTTATPLSDFVYQYSGEPLSARDSLEAVVYLERLLYAAEFLRQFKLEHPDTSRTTMGLDDLA